MVGDDLDAVRTRGRERVVDVRERLFVELAELGLDAGGTTNGVAHRLTADDGGAHLSGGRHGVVDLVVARKVRPDRIGRPVAGDAEPFDVRSAEPERPAGDDESRARARHKGVPERLRRSRGGGAGRRGRQDRPGGDQR